jgi:integrase
VADADVIVRDPVTGLFGFRLEMGRDHAGVRRQVRRTGFTTEKAALAEHRRLARQRDAQVARPRLSDSVQTVCQDWLRAREQELQPNTLYCYSWLLSLIYPHVGRVRASRLSARMTERAYRELEAAGYCRSTLRTLNLVLTKAFGEQTGRTLGACRPRESDNVRPVWTLAEARRFGEHVRDSGDRLYPLWRLLLVTGLRRGELCGLQWGDLEPDLATLRVCRQRVVEEPTSQVRDKPPKSPNSTRSLLLDSQTLNDNRRRLASARRGNQRIQTTYPAIAEPGALLGVAMYLNDRVVHVNQHRPADAGHHRSYGSQTGQQPGRDRIQLADMPEPQATQERPQRRGRVQPIEHLAHRPVP